MNNRLWNTKNPAQGEYKRVLCLCSAGLLRSPTTAVVLAGEPYNYNTRAAGVESDYALIPVDDVLIDWADEIVCVNAGTADRLRSLFHADDLPTVVVLNIPDNYGYRSPKLVHMIKEQYDKQLAELIGLAGNVGKSNM